MSERYRTIVADPPWPYERFLLGHHGSRVANGERIFTTPPEAHPLPYESMTLDEIRRLAVADICDTDCRLFLWATNRYLGDAFGICEAWGFDYRQTLVWHKTDVNLPGHVAPNSAEFILVGVRGNPARLSLMPSAVLATTRLGGPGHRAHSVKRECWLDYFEQVSPGPYAELFARRARFGWDYPIGDQSLGGVAA